MHAEFGRMIEDRFGFRAALVASFLGLATECGTSIHGASPVGQDSAARSEAGAGDQRQLLVPA
jgi:hypothetical protein